MRFLVIKQDTSLQALTAQLVKDGDHAPAALDRLRALNPHLDLQRVGKGAVLLLPDSPGYKDEGDKAGDDGFDLFAKVPHMTFPGGKHLRSPLLALGMLWHRLKELV